MSGSVSFSYLPQNLRVPLFWVEFDNSQAGVNQDTQRALLIGISAVSNPVAPVYIASVAQAISLFGQGSMLHRMVAAYRANDPFGELWALPVANPSGGAIATGSIVVTGPATAAGTLALYVAGQLVQVPVASGDSATVIAASIATALNAAADLPVSATSSTGTVTVTSDLKGVAQNGIDLRLNYLSTLGGEALPAGVTVAITALSGGTGTADLSGVAAALGDVDYDFIISGFSDTSSLTTLATIMADNAGRWGYASQLYGHVFAAAVDTSANLLTLGASRNNQHTTIWGSYHLPTPTWEFAAAMTAAVIPSLKADPARPLQTLSVNGVLAPAPVDRFTKTVQQSLLTTGIALPSYARDGSVSVLRAVTTYQLNKFGQADQSYLDVETLFTLMAVTRRLRAAVTQKFPRSKLADDGTRLGFGQPVVTPSIIRGEMIAQYATMGQDGLTENTDAFAKGLIVIRNDQDPSRADVLFDPYLVSGLRIFAVLNQFRLAAAA